MFNTIQKSSDQSTAYQQANSTNEPLTGLTPTQPPTQSHNAVQTAAIHSPASTSYFVHHATARQQKSVALFEAVESGDVQAVKACLAAGVNIESNNDKGETPLQMAARNGQSEALKAFLAPGIDVDAKAKKTDGRIITTCSSHKRFCGNLTHLACR